MIFRYERVADYNPIGQLNYMAFSNWHPDRLSVHESEMVALARQSSRFDPELSIVAERDGEVIGHVLLVPSDFMVLGRRVRGVLLGPIGVVPAHQKSGIGKKLIEKGHEAAREKGYEFSLLCGHPSYYPKFGYLQNVFSVAGTEIEIIDECKSLDELSERPLRLEDIPIIDKWQTRIRKEDSLAILHDQNLMDYHSYAHHMKGTVITKDDVPIGYVRYFGHDPSNVQTLFFEEGHLDLILVYMHSKAPQAKAVSIHQPPQVFEKLLSPKDFKVQDKRKTNQAFMICPLREDSVINTYCDQVLKKEIPPGVISYPPYCDVDL